MRIALLGNPNVGKSTIFNALTGLHQHTGNWTGKTVENAYGKFDYNNKQYKIYDLPGTYSLISNSKEEEIARDFICFENYDKIIIVCDALCLERNLNLVLQTLQITNNVVVCVNLMDEAKKKKIKINLKELSNILHIPVIGVCAKKKEGLTDLIDSLNIKNNNKYDIKYLDTIEEAINMVEPLLENKLNDKYNEFIALELINNNISLINSIKKNLNISIDKLIQEKLNEAKKFLEKSSIKLAELNDLIVENISKLSENISKKVIFYENTDYLKKDRKIDKFLTNKITGIPIMIILLFFILWITIKGANYPSQMLFNLFNNIGNYLNNFSFPLKGLLIDGIYKTLTWIISVMLPPMAIFFPLFTLLEDLGFLPRIAFNLDNSFKKSKSCGKQALTMCMGFGCNVVGVNGTRIIDSPRERLIAIITNVFVPCNGRFPIIITLIPLFLTSNFSTVFLLLFILIGIIVTFIVSKILSLTLLKGETSSFTLELPPYRKPQIIKTIITSILNRTLFILGKAVLIAIPAGAIIYVLSNVQLNNICIITYISRFLNPLGNLMGLDGVILLAFVLGFPANEIVLPIIIMCYTQNNILLDINDMNYLKELFISNGWTIITVISMIIFTLFHFPCFNTCLSIKKETKSNKWTFISILLPTLIGIVLCILINFIGNIIL